MQLELSVTCNPTNILSFLTSYSFFIFLKGAFTRIVLTRMIDIVVFSTLNVTFSASYLSLREMGTRCNATLLKSCGGCFLVWSLV